MKLLDILASAAVSAAIVIAVAGAGGYYVSRSMTGPAWAGEGGWHGAGRWFGHHRTSRHRGFLCSDGRHERRLARLAPHLALELDLTPEQRAPLEDLARDFDAESEAWRAALCDHGTDAAAPQHLTRLADAFEKAGQMIRAFQPRFETFYDGLTDAQRTRLDVLLAHRHGRN